MKFNPSAYGHVYLVTNTINGKRYVGQTTGHPECRWRQGHVRAANALRHVQMPIVLAIRKYGADIFTLDILSCAFSQQELDSQECAAVDDLNTFAPKGYNLRAGRGSGVMALELRTRISNNFSAELRNQFRLQYAGRRWSDLAYQRSAEATQVTYQVNAPNGEQLVITNFREYAAKYPGLNAGLLQSVARGRRWTHRGWFITKDDNWVAAVSLGDLMFSCPQCLVRWESMSQRHANTHVISCYRKVAMIQAAYRLGNISEDDLFKETDKLQQPHVMVRTRARNGRTYHLVSPNGDFVSVTDMKRFCLDQNLSPTKMSLVVNGRTYQHKGWTAERGPSK